LNEPSKIDPGHVLLRHDGAFLVLDPEHGGAIRECWCQGFALLRPSAPGAGADPLELACFPMVPYANRIAGGRFAAGGRLVQLKPNSSGDPHPLHGQGWRAHWHVTDASAADATLQLEAGGDEWPWRYRAEQHFRLTRSGLSVRLSVENLSDTPMPAVLGLHPYFVGVAEARLKAQLPRVWTVDAASLPLEELATPPAWSFAAGRALAAPPLDNCFSGWDGVAVLRWPDRSATLRATNCRFLQLYVPGGRDFFCLEPQTAATGALNRTMGEAALVRPGERFAMRMTLDLGAP
jgi:aldose 1-epimerase